MEKLTPAVGVQHEHPLVFFHGGAVSGVTWLNTPDGRQGLASYFLAKGYQVYLMVSDPLMLTFLRKTRSRGADPLIARDSLSIALIYPRSIISFPTSADMAAFLMTD